MGVSSRKKDFVLSKGKNEKNARYVLFGVPDESGSKSRAQSIFKGSSKGPDAIRAASQLCSANHRSSHHILETFVVNSFRPFSFGEIPFADIGNIPRKSVREKISSLLKQKKFPIVLGGDHSITVECIKGAASVFGKFGIVYFDAHPDFRKSGEHDYGAVMHNAFQVKGFSGKNTVLVGVRDFEEEEFRNLHGQEANFLTSLDIAEIGAKNAVKKIKKIVAGIPVYVSIDLDVVDPCFAPEVSLPSPCGLTGNELLFMLCGLAREKIIGLDIMEMTPRRNIFPEMLSGILASKLIIELVSRHSVRQSFP